MNENYILPSNHHGLTTTIAIIEMYESMIEAYENGQACALVPLDQSQAYDLIDHPILLERLIIIGADDSTIQLMGSYLSNRSQYV